MNIKYEEDTRVCDNEECEMMNIEQIVNLQIGITESGKYFENWDCDHCYSNYSVYEQ